MITMATVKTAETFYRIHPLDRPFDREHATSTVHGDTKDLEEVGFSSFTNPRQLYNYAVDMGMLNPLFADAAPQQVIKFTGEWVGSGYDGEDLAMPDMAQVERMSWEDFCKMIGRSPS